MAIVNTTITRNASAYWDLELWYGPYDQPSLISEFLPWSTTAGGIDRSILNKITEIRYKDVFNTQDYQVKGNAMDPFSSCIIRFEGLTKQEAAQPMFTMGIGFSLSAGWYSFYSGKEKKDTIFNGVIYKIDTEFGSNGIKIVIHLINPGVILLYSPLPSWDQLGVGPNSFANPACVLPLYKPIKRPIFRDVMTAICNYCGMGGILKITRNGKLAVYLAETKEWDGFSPPDIKGNQTGTNYPVFAPHLNIPPTIAESGGSKGRPINAADVFSWFAFQYGCVWNVRNNEIYFGELDLTPPLGYKKFFNYRGEQEAINVATTHLGNDPFETVRIVMTEGQDYNVTSNTFYDAGTRQLQSATNSYIEKNWRSKKQDVTLLKLQKAQQSLMNPQAAVAIEAIQAMAFKNQASALDHIGAMKMRKTPINSHDDRFTLNKEMKALRNEGKHSAIPVIAEEYKKLVEATLKEIDLRYVYGSVLCQIKGALADFNFQAGDRFLFYYLPGQEQHGVYMSDFVEYYYSKGSCWKMDISGRKPNTDDPSYDTKHVKVIDTVAGMRTVTLGTQIWMTQPDGGWAQSYDPATNWAGAVKNLTAASICNEFKLTDTLYYIGNFKYSSGSLSGVPGYNPPTTPNGAPEPRPGRVT